MEKDFSFELNSKVEVLWDDGIYKSIVQDLGDNYIGINIPVREGRYLPLTRGEKIECLYYCNKCIYKFNTVVIGKKIDGVFIILLAKPKKIKRIQRRCFVRVSIFSKITCSLVQDRNIAGNNQYDFFEVDMLDLSGGGVRISTDKKFNKGDSLIILLPLEENLTLKGKVVRVDTESSKVKNMYGVSFVDMNRKEVEKVVAFIFKTMREQRRKDLRG